LSYAQAVAGIDCYLSERTGALLQRLCHLKITGQELELIDISTETGFFFARAL
jgi:hypothetical protein